MSKVMNVNPGDVRAGAGGSPINGFINSTTITNVPIVVGGVGGGGGGGGGGLKRSADQMMSQQSNLILNMPATGAGSPQMLHTHCNNSSSTTNNNTNNNNNNNNNISHKNKNNNNSPTGNNNQKGGGGGGAGGYYQQHSKRLAIDSPVKMCGVGTSGSPVKSNGGGTPQKQIMESPHKLINSSSSSTQKLLSTPQKMLSTPQKLINSTSPQKSSPSKLMSSPNSNGSGSIIALKATNNSPKQHKQQNGNPQKSLNGTPQKSASGGGTGGGGGSGGGTPGSGNSQKLSGHKRSGGDSVSGPPKKKIKNGGSTNVTPQPKNTVAMLNELRQGLIYTLENQAGPVHAPIFTMSVEVDGQKYNGEGRSKKIARIQAAATALRSFIQFKDGALLTPSKQLANLDFTSDEHLENGIKKVTLAEKINKNLINKDGQKQIPEKGPVMLLYELFNDVNIECASSDGAQHSRFKMVATVNERKFEGTGPSKKLAKNAAAKAALAALCDISYSPMQSLPTNDALANNADKKESFELPQTFADAIGKLVLDKFAEVTVGIENYNRRKVLAGIVMIENCDINTAKVISVSTGTKCVNGEHLSCYGAVLNDSHAEIVSRRCLMDYFYSQLELHTSPATAKDSIFAKPTLPEQLYKIKPTIRFHLYINTAPCGDARIFSPHEDDMGVDKHPNRKARGQLRTKIESGEGTIPVKSSDGIQTWDGVMQGQRLLTMSCSDKIARWNVVGLQGALLASIIQPVYLHSIVLGSLLHPAHMYRAVCGRIETVIQGLPPPYFLNKPKFALVTSAETRNQIKAPNFGINWTIGCKAVEVVNSLTGKTITNKVSRITKQAFFAKYATLIKRLPMIQIRHVTGDYGETKLAVKDYQIAKNELVSAFKREDLGLWLKKPMEQDQFMIPE